MLQPHFRVGIYNFQNLSEFLIILEKNFEISHDINLVMTQTKLSRFAIAAHMSIRVCIHFKAVRVDVTIVYNNLESVRINVFVYFADQSDTGLQIGEEQNIVIGTV
jgi:hypothetical protein